MDEQTDEALMIAYQQGDDTALEFLVRRHADHLLGYLVRLTRNRAQAEDLFQETFLRVHRKASSFRADRGFKPWLFSIASHLAIDSMRKAGREPRTTLPDSTNPLHRIVDPDPNPSELAERADRVEQVRKALDSLPPRQRATLVLAFFEDLNYRDVARSLGCSVGTVKTQVSRALRTLARILPEPGRYPGGAA